MPPTRRRLGCRPAARPAGQEPAFRADPTSERNDLPIRSVRFSIRANGKPRRAAIPATRRKTREKKRDEFPGYRPETYRAPGDRTGNAAGERSERPRVRFGLAEPESEEARATGLRAVRVGLSRQKRRASPEHLPNPITYFVTPAILGGVFGSYFPMAGNPLAWSRLENTCTWHIRYINAYNRSAKYFSIPKPG